VKLMSGKKKIEEDYNKFENDIEQMAQEELSKIRKKASLTKVEAEEIGESIEQTLDENAHDGDKKKS
jgi:MOSC domain-containing protein YiiM